MTPSQVRPIIAPMRRLLLALMIVMLPLRGWMGDVMAMQTLHGLHGTIETIATGDHSTTGSGHFDAETSGWSLLATPSHCADHGPASPHAPTADLEAATGDHDGSHAGAQGGACNACQVCHSLAMSAELPALTAGPLPVPAPAGGAAAFTSAVPAPGLKPPIS